MLCCVEGGKGIMYLETFRDIVAVLCGVGGGIKYLETFRDIGAVLCGGWAGTKSV